MLIFIVQTFWLFIDEFAGKGLDFEIIAKFLMYYSPKLIPLVLPLSVLLSSIMTYGEFAENYEFAAMKSSGISLSRALKTLIIFHFFLGIGSFFFSNYIVPYGELKYYNLRRNLGKLKPALAITEGIFNDFGQMNIKVKKKSGPNDRILTDVIIHEKTPDQKNRIVIKSVSGELNGATDDKQIQLILYDGYRYEEIYSNTIIKDKNFPHAKVFFEKYIMNIDLSKFNNIDLNEEKFTSTYRMQNVKELEESIDSLQIKMDDQKIDYSENFSTTNSMFRLPETKDRILKDSIFKKAVELTIVLQKNSALILRDSLDVGLNTANYLIENLLYYNIINKLDSNLVGDSQIKNISDIDYLLNDDHNFKIKLNDPLSFTEKGPLILEKQEQVLSSARISVGNILKNLDNNKKRFFAFQKLINLHKTSFNEKYTLGFGIFFLFIVGATLGSIIRKGGLGLPIVFSVLIFLTYHYIGLFGKNAAEDSTISPMIGSWMSTVIIALVSYFMLKKATSDRNIFTFDNSFGLIKTFSYNLKTLFLKNDKRNKT
tara:strand:+ start:334 stop:1959 length:1626 start_codon:yes stop_codon:yes gene_type:complete